MKNLIAELLIKLAERDEEYKLQTERLAAMEVMLSVVLDSLPEESRHQFETKLYKRLAESSDSAHGIPCDDSYSRYIAEISAVNYP